ncbi:hypothetical protein KKB10_05105 [Patescibacteria group bacterium]|nr:hypothetical protein [Patescibacteria group bacterium]MBU1952462.1 hypothetical protein [Patescibacteria group bacterium]
MRRTLWLLYAALLLLGVVGTLGGCEHEEATTHSSLPLFTPNTGTYEEAVAELQAAETDEEAFAILDRYPNEVRDGILSGNV